MRLQLNNLSFKVLSNDPIIRNFRISRGETFILDLFFVDQFNYFFPHNLFGAKALLTVKKLVSDTDGNAVIRKDTSPNPSGMGGEVIIKVPASETEIDPGNYIYSVKIVEINGNITRVMYGNICIDYDVTQRDDIYEA